MCTKIVHTIHIFNYSTGSSSVWDERLIWDQEAAGSSPVYPILLADMAELADAIDLGSIGVPCGFKSHYPHHPRQRMLLSVEIYGFIISLTYEIDNDDFL